MEAIQRITKDTKAIDEMKRWLLKQKQTQTPIFDSARKGGIYASNDHFRKIYFQNSKNNTDTAHLNEKGHERFLKVVLYLTVATAQRPISCRMWSAKWLPHWVF